MPQQLIQSYRDAALWRKAKELVESMDHTSDEYFLAALRNYLRFKGLSESKIRKVVSTYSSSRSLSAAMAEASTLVGPNLIVKAVDQLLEGRDLQSLLREVTSAQSIQSSPMNGMAMIPSMYGSGGVCEFCQGELDKNGDCQNCIKMRGKYKEGDECDGFDLLL